MVFHVDILELNGKLKNVQRARVILIIFCIILAIAAIVLIISYVLMENKYIAAVNLCEDNLCMRSAATLRLAMNTSVDPCDDFFRFACGHWPSEHPDHGWFSPVSAFTMVEETVTAATLKFLKTNASKTEPLPVKQSRDLFASCMNQVAADKLGYTPIFKYLSLLGLPSIPTFMNLSDNEYTKEHRLNWTRVEALSTRLLGIQSLVGFSVTHNVTNNSQHYMMMGMPPMIDYPLPSFLTILKQKNYKNWRYSKEENKDNSNSTKNSAEKVKKIVHFLTYTVVEANYTEYSELPDNFSRIISKTADTIIELSETVEELYSIAIAPENCTNSTDCDDEIIGISINELQNKTNEYMHLFNLTPIEIWKPYLRQMFDGLNVTLDFNKNDTIFLDQYDVLYLVTIVRYFSELPDELTELWFWWRTMLHLVLNSTTKIKDYFEDLSNTKFDEPRVVILSGAPLLFPKVLELRRWLNPHTISIFILKCIGTTKEYMGMAISYAIADKIIIKETRQRVEDMILDIKIAFTQRIKKIKWMDKKTKILTLEKCKAMLSLVGYPDWLMENGALERYYSNLTLHPDTYVENMLSIVQLNVRKNLLQLYTGHDITWPPDTYPVTANAFHVPWDNSIVVPMAFLFYPLYNLGLEVLNYAATGSTLGHELIHGFDNTGRQFDKYGNNIQWWDQEVIEKFEELADCFVEQYNKFYVPEVNIYVNGEISLGENIADNDGLRLAYMAYKNYRKRNKKEPKLPGLGQFSQDQMFFIAYASTWCDEIKLDNMAYYEEEPHCPKIYRLIGSLQNSEEFAKAFHCPKGSNMNPDVPKCSIW